MLKTRYEIVRQEPFMCVPATIQMILKRRGISFPMTQREIGLALGWAEKTGTQIQKPEFEPNKIFAQIGLPLSFEYIPISKIASSQELVKIINEIIAAGDDAVICWKVERRNGHVAAVDKIDDEAIRYVCTDCGGRIIEQSTEYIYGQMKEHTDAMMGGVWVFRSKN